MIMPQEYGQVRGETWRAAAPEGGAWKRVRGCAKATALVFAFASMSTFAQGQTVPSGQSVELAEVLVDQVEKETWLRVRFVAPQIASTKEMTYAVAAADMEALCAGYVQDYIATHELRADVIVMSFMSEFLPFGEADPSVVQFFEAYRFDGEFCVWEVF